ncbi:MAG: xanthine dehydrogenase family protein subunit M [Deltaproteobacteria bacterium]|nr:xanthine dehydrogenase family protein subunit M [Deltaproteobacteria bacterium]
MLIPRFNYHKPSTLKEACEIKGELKDKSMLLSGGTDLIVNMKGGVISPENIISLNGIEELKLHSVDGRNGQTHIGACGTVSSLIKEKFLLPYSALVTGMDSLGSPIIRNLATIGGNIVNARPAADIPPSLIAFNGKATLCSRSDKRVVSMDEFFLSPGKTILNNDEILSEIILDNPSTYSGSAYIKLGTRKALEISIVNVAVFISLEKPNGPITGARIVMGAVGPVPMRASTAEDMLIGERPSEALFAEAGKAASGDAGPIDDFRGSAEYRRDMITVLTERALKKALDEIK